MPNLSTVLLLFLLPNTLARFPHQRQNHRNTHGRRYPGVSRINNTQHVDPQLPPTGWSLYTASDNDGGGCYSDLSNRLVQAHEIDIATNGLSSCLTHCQKHEYMWASIENGDQCYCASSLGLTITSASTSECTIPCTADDSSCKPKVSVYKYSRHHEIVVRETSTAQWTYQGCTSDSAGRILPYEVDNPNMSPGMCISACAGLGYVYAGIEFGVQCFCGNSLGDGAGYTSEDTCNYTCGGKMRGCGGGWALSLWQQASPDSPDVETVPSGTASVVDGQTITGTASLTGTSTGSSTSGSSTASVTGSITLSPSGTSVATSASAAASTSASSNSGATVGSTSISSSSNTKYVWAHHIVGNTYPYDYNAWMSDINMAQGAGIDGFILNIGTDSWQTGQVASAYSAAQNAGFKMMLSLDMTVFGCGDWSSVSTLQTYLNTYINHPAAAKVNGLSTLTTFAGDSCNFGQASTNAGWSAVFGNLASSIYFMPAYFSSVTSLGSYNIQAEVNWDGAWPMGSTDIDSGNDQYYMSNLAGKGYVATISPLFNTHLSYKNWIYRSDDWLFAMRWEQVLAMRSQIDQVEIVTWNDYGEAHYIGPITGAMPDGSEEYVNSDFPHSDILSLNAFYAQAWKTGYYPTIYEDKAWVMARPHPAGATASSDPYGQPTGAGNTQDNFYAQVHLTGSATVTLCSGGCKTFSGNSGINRFSYPLQVGSGMSVQVVRDGQTTVNLSPSFTFNGSPQQYNFNYLIKSS